MPAAMIPAAAMMATMMMPASAPPLSVGLAADDVLDTVTVAAAAVDVDEDVAAEDEIEGTVQPSTL